MVLAIHRGSFLAKFEYLASHRRRSHSYGLTLIVSLPFILERLNMFDNFELNKCHIVEETYHDEDGDDKKATVKFVAEMALRESGEVTGFMETSEFERAKTHGGWLYRNGTIDAVPDEVLVKNLDTKKD